MTRSVCVDRLLKSLSLPAGCFHVWGVKTPPELELVDALQFSVPFVGKHGSSFKQADPIAHRQMRKPMLLQFLLMQPLLNSKQVARASSSLLVSDSWSAIQQGQQSPRRLSSTELSGLLLSPPWKGVCSRSNPPECCSPSLSSLAHRLKAPQLKLTCRGLSMPSRMCSEGLQQVPRPLQPAQRMGQGPEQRTAAHRLRLCQPCLGMLSQSTPHPSMSLTVQEQQRCAGLRHGVRAWSKTA